MGENGSSLDFNFILLPSPTADKNWISQLSSVALSLKNAAAQDVPID